MQQQSVGKCSIRICHELFLESGIYVKIPQWINARLIEKKETNLQ